MTVKKISMHKRLLEHVKNHNGHGNILFIILRRRGAKKDVKKDVKKNARKLKSKS